MLWQILLDRRDDCRRRCENVLNQRLRGFSQSASGRQVIEVVPANTLQPGIYWVRASLGALERTLRVAVVR